MAVRWPSSSSIPSSGRSFAASFRDRIVHHLLYRWLLPIVLPRFIYDSYSCIEGRGTDFGVARLEHFIWSVSQNYTKPCWVLRLDLKGYFMAINRRKLFDIILALVHKTGNDRRPEWPVIRYLLGKVIFNDCTKGCRIKGSRADWKGLPKDKSLFHSRAGCGLPIGNLTSQLFSNIYLDLLDQYCKRVLKCRCYGRYVDDIFIVGHSREELLPHINAIRTFLKDELFLDLHPKKIWLHRQEEGVPFLGVILKNGKRQMSRRSRHKMQTRLTDAVCFENNPFRVRACMESYKGFSGKFPDGKKLIRKFQPIHSA